MFILRLEPPIEMDTPRGRGLAVLFRDYGHDTDDMWTVVLGDGTLWGRGGRKAGIPNKVTRELKEIAQAYTEEAILTAATIMRSAKKPAAARLTAVSIILDRGHGKPPQSLEHHGPRRRSDNPRGPAHGAQQEGVNALARRHVPRLARGSGAPRLRCRHRGRAPPRRPGVRSLRVAAVIGLARAYWSRKSSLPHGLADGGRD